jgi:hypothetical protein
VTAGHTGTFTRGQEEDIGRKRDLSKGVKRTRRHYSKRERKLASGSKSGRERWRRVGGYMGGKKSM